MFMWILQFLPDTIIHILLVIGGAGVIAGFLLGFIPFISQYKLPIQIISILVLAFALYMEGGLAEKQRQELEIAALKQRLLQAEVDSLGISIKVVEKIVTQTEVVKEKGKNIIRYIDREVVKYDDKCDIPDVVIIAHNAAALNHDIEVTQ